MRTGRVLMAALLFTAFSVLVHMQGWGADWKVYATSHKGTFYYDGEDITRPSKGVVRVLTKTVYTEKGVSDFVAEMGDKFKTLTETIVLREVQCADKKVRLLSSTAYSSGEVLYSSTDPEPEWFPITPDSVGELLFQKLCK